MIQLHELEVYKLSMEISRLISEIVCTWKIFDKDTLGKQLIRAADSIALNISEGYGRYHFKENKNFCYYSRRSAFETRCALEKAKERKLITEQVFNEIDQQLITFLKLLNGYIRSIGTGATTISQ